MKIKERFKGAIYGWKHGLEYDSLTGLHTRSYLEYELWFNESQRAKRYGHPLSIVFLDVDGLKQINDSMGHAAGDCALMALASGITRQIRIFDILIRYGGDEFLLVLPETDSVQTRMLMDKICGHMPVGIQFSFGVSEWMEGLTLKTLCKEADKELYEQKEQKKEKRDRDEKRRTRTKHPQAHF